MRRVSPISHLGRGTRKFLRPSTNPAVPGRGYRQKPDPLAISIIGCKHKSVICYIRKILNKMTTFPLQDQDLFRHQAYIGGRWCDADSGATLKVNNPATGEILGTVPLMTANETRRAIEAAKEAFIDWRRKPAKERSFLLRRWHDLIMSNVDDLGALMTAEQGKPLAEAKGEVAYAASFIEWFGEEAKRVYGDTIPSPWSDRRLVVIKQPIGVCAAITPWNFPAAMIARKAGPALASGCTMVAKPASSTPFSALALAVLAERAGVPPGVFNVLTGSSKEIGGELTSNPIVSKITFTGSTEVGRLLMKQSSSTVKKLSLELGGNAPFIVFDDADLDAAVEGAIISKYRNAGQTCFEPTVVADVTPKMNVAKEETFGPLARLFRFRTDEQAIEMANDTEFGLASYFYGRDIGRIWRVAEGLECGMVGINTG